MKVKKQDTPESGYTKLDANKADADFESMNDRANRLYGWVPRDKPGFLQRLNTRDRGANDDGASGTLIF